MRRSGDPHARALGVPRRRFRGHPGILLLSTVLVFALDQSSKVIARAFQLGASAQNDSHPVHWWWVLPIFGLVAALAPSRRVAIFSSLFLGGFLGNLVDYRVEVAPETTVRVQAAPQTAFGVGDRVHLAFAPAATWSVPRSRS